MSASHLGPSTASSGPLGDKLIRLVAVGLKEASTDSPSFRASMKYIETAVAEMVHSLRQILAFFQRYSGISADLDDLQDEFNLVFGPIGTAEASNELLNKDIAAPCLEQTIGGTNSIFRIMKSLMWFESPIFDEIQKFLDNDIANYWTLQRQFQSIQSKYDGLWVKYMSLPKSHDPAETREDAVQLFEIRKQYVHLALSLWIFVKQLDYRISLLFVNICNSLWPSAPKFSLLAPTLGLSPVYKSIMSLKASLFLQLASYKTLMGNLTTVRESSERGIVDLFSPSSEMTDYDPAHINDGNLYLKGDAAEQQFEKHGWVFLKSRLIGTGELVWIRRWLFVKADVYGFLSISNNGQYVEESDKFGILLANVTYLPEENRKFCFQIRTLQASLVLQVETLGDLRSWLTVFRTVKFHAMKEDMGFATSRYQPLVDLLRLVPVVEADYSLVASTQQEDKIRKLVNGQLMHIHPVLDINPPMTTQMTSLAVLSHLYLSSAPIPGASTGNFWGFVNWGLYYVVNRDSKAFLAKMIKARRPKPSLIVRYSESYPHDLKMADVELRSIFEGFIGPKELVLIRFKASWSPNSSQELFCKIYVTENAFYIYTNNCGLISVSPLPLTDFLYGEVVPKTHCDVIKVYLVSGLSIKMKVFIGSAYVICDQINLLLRSGRSSKPRSMEDLISNFKKLEKQAQKTETEAIGVTPVVKSAVVEATPSNSVITVPEEVFGKGSEGGGLMKFRNGSLPVMLCEKSYNLPAKALFHILLGDESFMLQCMQPETPSAISDKGVGHTPWRCNEKQVLSRIVWDASNKNVGTLQQIDKMVNNKYYSFTQTSPKLRILFGVLRRVQLRFVISNLSYHTCGLVIYYHLEKKDHRVAYFVQKMLSKILRYRVEELDIRIRGTQKLISKESRKIASSIKLFGLITKFDSNEPMSEELTFESQVKYVSAQQLIVCYIERLNFVAGRIMKVVFEWMLLVGTYLMEIFKGNLPWIGLLVLSSIVNLVLVGRTSYSYWEQRSIEQYANELSERPSYMQRQISISEMNEILQPRTSQVSYNSSRSLCFQEFSKVASLMMIGKAKEDSWGSSMTDSLIGLRLKRNELLAQMNILNSVERSYIYKEWQNWVLKEHKNCELVRKKFSDKYDTEVEEYCDSVSHEMEYLYQVLM
ncbi:hypothetical protein FOA43_002920 [Brettanomyces nanus]|uniref:PH domain-containing protein n=1 Tax=Eeniella nana TaxID=13502 RepID=A0A875S5D1_EENNA|nr:uncharacterized protein FOA43_002920 [Brettanomyces nanus]QPG75565.1 hypothetical protein FOA43_002920 [Brettanomyces nanus]